MKFAVIMIHRSFRFHCATVGSNFSMTVTNYPRSSDPSLTCQTNADHFQLLFSPDTSSPTDPIFHPIFHPTLRSVGQRDAGLSSSFMSLRCSIRPAQEKLCGARCRSEDPTFSWTEVRAHGPIICCNQLRENIGVIFNQSKSQCTRTNFQCDTRGRL